jgi:hypothetical protein
MEFIEELTRFSTNICTECGQEYERGLMSWMRHNDECKHDGENENIGSHSRQVEWEKRKAELQAEHDKIFEVIWPKMSEDEQNNWCLLNMNYMQNIGGVMFVGSAHMKMIKDFDTQMKLKYYKS